jgi:lysophospholipase L1-like esterase
MRRLLRCRSLFRLKIVIAERYAFRNNRHKAMRYLLIIFVVIFVGCTTQPQVHPPRGPGDVYLALGDSLAWGFQLDDRTAESYPALIYAELATTAPIRFTSLAFPGETTGSFLTGQLTQAIAFIAAAQRDGLRVSPITITIGGNDLRNVERAGPERRAAAVTIAQRNLARILDELRTAAPNADIAIMTYYNPYGGDPNVLNSEAYWVTQLNNVIIAEATQRGVSVADVFTPFEGGRAYTHTFILFGDVHANAAGHLLMAEVFWTALEYEYTQNAE